jgi:hypothetical protein
MAKWTTDEQLTVAPDGTVEFTGYFGDYDVTIDGKTVPLTLRDGVKDYTLSLK